MLAAPNSALLGLRNRLAGTAMMVVECHGRTDRRVIEALLDETHATRHGGDRALRSGTLCYVLRSTPEGSRA